MVNVFGFREETQGRSPLTHHLLVRLKRSLRERQREVLSELRELSQSSASSGTTSGEAQDTLRYSFGATKSRLQAEAAAVRAALARIRSGHYGVCASCNERIDHHRLGIVPEAELCTTCQWRAESASRHSSGSAPARKR